VAFGAVASTSGIFGDWLGSLESGCSSGRAHFQLGLALSFVRSSTLLWKVMDMGVPDVYDVLMLLAGHFFGFDMRSFVLGDLPLPAGG